MEEYTSIRTEVQSVVEELISAAQLKEGQLLVVGCSTSEVQGQRIGSSGSALVAAAILETLQQASGKDNICLAIQCCEHLNRALVVERETAERYGLLEVAVVPVPKAGGALAAAAFRKFSKPVVVETIEAHAGIDIGLTLIGMHLKKVAVPVRLKQKTVGQAIVTAAKTRPKLIGGVRAVYVLPNE